MYTRVRGVYIQASLHKSLSRRQNQDQIKEYQVKAKVWQIWSLNGRERRVSKVRTGKRVLTESR